MDAWLLNRYSRPRLQVDAVGRENDGRTVTVTAGKEVYRLACDSESGAKRVAANLIKLRDPEAAMWRVVRDSGPESGWGIIGSFLDARSLIAETADGTENLQVVKARGVADRVAAVALSALEGMEPAGLSRVRANAAAVLDRIGYQLSDGGRWRSGPDLCATASEQNFFLGLLGLEFTYMRRCAPVALVGSTLLLTEIAGRNAEQTEVWAERIAADIDWNYEERDFDAHLTLVTHCIVRSVDRTAKRFLGPPLPPLTANSGLEFMRQAELLTRAALADWGPNRYVSAVAGLSNIESPLVTGCYIEEYHVTRRFVEIITPMLRKRLSNPLRALMFRYYSEELGHEEFERATCEALGVKSASLDRAVPLPLHWAFLDALTEAAEQDPVAFFAIVMVTEGMLGDLSILSERFAEVGRRRRQFSRVSQRHDQLNQDLHHASIARLAFEKIATVSPDRQRRALNWLLFMLELNHRAWDAVSDFYGEQIVLHMHGILGRPWIAEE
jgi:Iron-containing redox enzyme